MPDNPPIAFLAGPSVILRPIEQGDWPLLCAWANDRELRVLTGRVFPTSLADLEAHLEKERADPASVWFAITLKNSGQLIGECGLIRMFPPWRTTDLSIIIGDRDAWGKGYGTEAIVLLMDYAFGHLSFHRVAIGVVGTNARALRFYAHMGFRREGVQRDGYYCRHAFQDFNMLSILEDEYRARWPPGPCPPP
jgi:RimJ/RimL family protein N-acetyltransferase